MQRSPVRSSVAILACLSVVGFVGWRAGAESAETRVMAQPTSVAVVNVMRALNELDELKALNGPLNERGNERQAQLDVLKKEVENLQIELQELPATKRDRRLEIQARIFELNETIKARFNAYQRIIELEKGGILYPLYQKVLAGVEEISTREGYELVLFDNRELQVPQDSQAVVSEAIQQKSILYAAERIDITDQVVQLLNNKFQAGAD